VVFYITTVVFLITKAAIAPSHPIPQLTSFKPTRWGWGVEEGEWGTKGLGVGVGVGGDGAVATVVI
jgi:hypothetical protein